MFKKVFLLTFVGVFIFAWYALFVPASNFPVEQNFRIEDGETGEEVYASLEQKGYICSAFLAKGASKVFFDLPLQNGTHTFAQPLSLWQTMVALRIPPVKVRITIPEGFTKQQVADRLEKNMQSENGASNFDSDYFLKNIEEGYIFPETYYFDKSMTIDEILARFIKEREEKFKSLSRMPTREEIILASILEREAKGSASMKMVAGIIYNRLEVGMPLQVDATVLYAKGWKDRVTFKDLMHESDYNTYLNKGLPPGAISNPGAQALEAAMHPTNSSYVYYLTGSDGTMHYAKTFEEHVKNKRYL